MIGWFYVPKGSNLNRANHKLKPTLIATSTIKFVVASRVKLTIKLTNAGKQKLGTARSLKLTCRGTYTPTTSTATTALKTFALRR